MTDVVARIGARVDSTCVLASDLSAVEAIMATDGERMAAMYGWQGPFPDPVACEAKKTAAEVATNEKVGAHYAVLHTEELAELAVLLGHLEAAALASSSTSEAHRHAQRAPVAGARVRRVARPRDHRRAAAVRT